MFFSFFLRELVCISIIFGALNCAQVSAGPAVNVALQASFNSPPYLLELLETAAEENSTSYFPLLDRIAEGRFAGCSTDHELYTTFLQVVQDDGHITDPDAVASLQFALSIHSAAPRIEAHYQYYDTSVEPSLMIAQDAACPVWVHFHGKQYCSPALDRAQQDIVGLKSPDALPFDRILGESSDPLHPSSVLYADITSPLFGQFHQTISKTARSGHTSYRIRYRPSLSSSGKPLVVNGYGIELALKRTDYIVIDDRDASGGENMVEASEVPPIEQQDVVLETEELADLKPLSAKEVLGLGLKAASFVMASEDPFDTLLRVSQDFPKHSLAITKRNTSTDFVAEHRKNREILLPAGFNVIWMNGRQIEARQMDAFALLERLRRERSILGSVKELGFTGSEAVQILSHPAIAESKTNGESQRYDYRDEIEKGKIIIWLNDIEKDKRYEGWSTHSSALLQRTYPGQLPTIRRDIHNVVIPLDMTDVKDVELLVESLQAFVKRKVPIQFGIVPMPKSKSAADQALVIHYLQDTYGLGAVFAYLEASTKNKKLSSVDKAIFGSVTKGRKLRKDREALSLQSILESDDSQAIIQASRNYLKRLGADGKSPLLFVNGAVVPRDEGWLQAMSSKIDMDLRFIQREVYEETIPEDSWLAGRFLEKAATYRNRLVVPEDENSIKIIDVGSLAKKHGQVLKKLPLLLGEQASENFPVQLLVVADLDTEEGSKLANEAVEFTKQQPEVELVLLHNALSPTSPKTSVVLSNFGKDQIREFDARALQAVLNRDQNDDKLEDSREPQEESEEFWQSVQPLVKAIDLRPGEQGLLLNGRLVGPIPKATGFTSNDFQSLLAYEQSKRLKPAESALAALGFQDRVKTSNDAAVLSSLIALSTISDVPEGIFESASTLRMTVFDQWESNHTMISTGDPETASIHLVASIDPTSEIAQRWIPMLRVLSDLSGVHLKLFLNPKERMQELPIKRFYRHVLDAKPFFTEDGDLRDLQATFEGLPKEALLNLALDVPPAWLVAPKESVHDLDNIKLSSLKDGSDVDAVYELEHILIEGHSRDVTTGSGSPPRGVQLLLGTEKDPHFADTIIMANLGYFQFKANPGYWRIQLQPGRSQQIFHIDSAGQNGYSPQPGDESTEVALMSFQGKTLYPRLSRRPGQETEDVLEESVSPGSPLDYLSKASKFTSSLLSTVGLTGPQPPKNADINIFSVASGHLYERMLNIMMVSVMRHTTHTVKFWFIEQFLSPSFKASLPYLARHYNFSYALVTYKWPHWLREQKEKQREIWGYKILFLDVLFPLSLDKVIFVDADQIVRTDMYDLVTHDLQGAPYGFTPMCDSRTEMEGFRFWKQGYWKTFLRGLPYHISALYVVDLRKFREIAAGDRLRQQYHQLSADPNSLSNLDQDLPNHMQMVLPIHSLPQHWLWCETWCSDESLAEAKTIDLCNNPLTKEPKLERARRQVPEWTVYDEEIAGVLREIVGKGKGDGGADMVSEMKGQVQDQAQREEARRVEDAGKDVRDEL